MDITIREFTLGDVETTYRYSSDGKNREYMLDNPDASVMETKEYIRKCIAEYQKEHPKYLAFAVLCDGEHIGEVFAYFEEGYADIGWIIYEKYRGRGYAVSAAKLLLERLKADYRIDKIVAYCDRRNLSSQRVMKKLGMTFVGDNGIREYDRDQTPDLELKYVLNN